MRQTLLRRLMVMVCLSVLPLASAGAQGASVEVFMGQYTPTQDLYQVTKAGAAGTYRLDGGGSRGGTVSLNLNDRVGLRASGGEVTSALTFKPVATTGGSTVPATLRHASVQGVLGLTPGHHRAQPYFSFGVSYAQRGGAAFVGQSKPSSYGYALGAGVKVRVAALALSLGAEMLDYSASYEVAGKPPRDFIQRDILLRLGAGLAVGR